MENKSKNIIDVTFYLQKRIVLFIEDDRRIIPRKGILKGFDDIHYYLEFIEGPKKGILIGYKKLSVRRIEPLQNDRGDVK